MATAAPTTLDARPSRRDLLSAAGFTGLAMVSTVGWLTTDAPATVGSLSPPVGRERSPDARLLSLVADYLKVDQQFNELHEPFYSVLMDEIPAWVDEQSRPLVERTHRLRRLIGKTPARTEAGRVAKARAALMHACIMIGSKLDEGSDDFIAHSLCQDLLRGAVA